MGYAEFGRGGAGSLAGASHFVIDAYYCIVQQELKRLARHC